MTSVLPLTFRSRLLRVRVVLLGLSHGQISAVHHKDVQLSELLDVVHCKLDASLDFNVTKVNVADAAADLLDHK